MPPFIRPRFRRWDWFTPSAIRHLPLAERVRLVRETREVVQRHPVYRSFPFLLLLYPTFFWLTYTFRKVLPMKLMAVLMCTFILLSLVLLVVAVLWRRSLFRRTLRQKLLDAGIRPRVCFECGYYVEGFEGAECPSCDAPLIRAAASARPAGLPSRPI